MLGCCPPECACMSAATPEPDMRMRVSAGAQVVCAGVWHNAVLCAACWALAFCLPWLLLPLYATGRGAVVRWAALMPARLPAEHLWGLATSRPRDTLPALIQSCR